MAALTVVPNPSSWRIMLNDIITQVNTRAKVHGTVPSIGSWDHENPTDAINATIAKINSLGGVSTLTRVGDCDLTDWYPVMVSFAAALTTAGA